VVNEFKNKKIILPLIFGVLFSILYYILPIKYFGASIVGFIAIILVFYDIRMGILAGVSIVPFLPDTLNILYMIFLVGVFAYQRITKKDVEPLTKSPIDMPIILFGIIIMISTITSINPTGSFRDLAIHLSGLGFLFVMVNSIRDLEDFNKVVTILVFSATLVALYGLYQYVVGVEMDPAWVDTENNQGVTTRIYSVFGNPNILAEYLLMTIPMSVGLFWHSKKLSKKVIFLGSTLIMMLALVLTLSRGAWVGIAMAALIFIILVDKRILLSIIPLSLGAVYLLPQTILNRIVSIGNLQDSSNAYRIEMWGITADIIRDNWMVGVGFGHLPFKQTFETYIRTLPTYHAHNTYLQIAAEIGIPGLIAFLFFIFILFKYGIHKLIKNENKYINVMGAGSLAVIGGLLAQGLSENVFYLPKIIITFWILVSFILTLIRISEKEENLS
jgi:O-antigen ligase